MNFIFNDTENTRKCIPHDHFMLKRELNLTNIILIQVKYSIQVKYLFQVKYLIVVRYLIEVKYLIYVKYLINVKYLI